MCVLASILNFLATNKDAFETLKNVSEIIALIVGGFWTYQIFILKRGKHPRAKLEQQIMCWPLVNGKRAIRVIITIQNSGEILLKLSEGFTWIQQIEPLQAEFEGAIKCGNNFLKEGETEIQWPLIGECNYSKKGKMEIEPGEDDQIICDFVIDSSIKRVLIYSHIENETKKVMTWLEKIKTDNVAEDEKKITGDGIGWNVSTLFDFSEQLTSK
jgi:hypothetical protein